jgi:hypothetical protein
MTNYRRKPPAERSRINAKWGEGLLNRATITQTPAARRRLDTLQAASAAVNDGKPLSFSALYELGLSVLLKAALENPNTLKSVHKPI